MLFLTLKFEVCGCIVDFDSRVYFLVIFYCTIVQNLHGIGKILKRRTWEILGHPNHRCFFASTVYPASTNNFSKDNKRLTLTPPYKFQLYFFFYKRPCLSGRFYNFNNHISEFAENYKALHRWTYSFIF